MNARKVPRKEPTLSRTVSASLDDAIESLDAETLRRLMRGMLPAIRDRDFAEQRNAIMEAAARKGTPWKPPGLHEKELSEVFLFIEAARRVGHADPEDIEELLAMAGQAFFAKEYDAAARIVLAVIPPIFEFDIDLGQEETVEDVLGTDLSRCAAQCLVAVYMKTPPAERVRAILQALETLENITSFQRPVRMMEEAALEPLPEKEAFLREWRAFLEKDLRDRPKKPREKLLRFDDCTATRLREVILLQEGPDGLGLLARKTKQQEDLRAWCRSLVDRCDWSAALAAFETATALVSGDPRAAATFLDGAALAAQQLGSNDLPERLRRAWEEESEFFRLRRWLGAVPCGDRLAATAGEAQKHCFQGAFRQRAFLHLLLGQIAPAAKLLAAAAGLGWSNDRHPGHLVFIRLYRIFGRGPLRLLDDLCEWARTSTFDEGSFREYGHENDPFRLETPDADVILDRIQHPVCSVPDSVRAEAIRSMRMCAQKRVQGVAQKKRRRYYAHAALLVAACVELDPESSGWADGLRANYSRYPSLKSEFKRHLNRL